MNFLLNMAMRYFIFYKRLRGFFLTLPTKNHTVSSLKLRGNHHIIQVVLLSGDLKVIDMFFKALTKNKYYYKYFKSQYSTKICIQRIVAHFIRHNLTTFTNFIRRSLNPEDPEIKLFTNEKFVEMQSIFFETLKFNTISQLLIFLKSLSGNGQPT